MIEVHCHKFAQRNLYIFEVENDSLCICCQEEEFTMYLVERFEKWFNDKNALSFSPTGFSQNCHLGKPLLRLRSNYKNFEFLLLLWLITIKPSLTVQFCVTLVYRFACEYYENKGNFI